MREDTNREFEYLHEAIVIAAIQDLMTKLELFNTSKCPNKALYLELQKYLDTLGTDYI